MSADNLTVHNNNNNPIEPVIRVINNNSNLSSENDDPNYRIKRSSFFNAKQNHHQQQQEQRPRSFVTTSQEDHDDIVAGTCGSITSQRHDTNIEHVLTNRPSQYEVQHHTQSTSSSASMPRSNHSHDDVREAFTVDGREPCAGPSQMSNISNTIQRNNFNEPEIHNNNDTSLINDSVQSRSFSTTFDLKFGDCGLVVPGVNVREVFLRRLLEHCRQKDTDKPRCESFEEFYNTLIEMNCGVNDINYINVTNKNVDTNVINNANYVSLRGSVKLLPRLQKCAIGMEKSFHACNGTIRHIHCYFEFETDVSLSLIRKFFRYICYERRLDCQIPKNYRNVLKYIGKEDNYPFYYQIKISDRGERQRFLDMCSRHKIYDPNDCFISTFKQDYNYYFQAYKYF